MEMFLAGFRLAVFLSTSGAIFAIGFVAVCRWLKWPTITLTINNPPGVASKVEITRGET